MSTVDRLEREVKLAGQLVDAGMVYGKHGAALTAFIILLEDTIRERKQLEDANLKLAELLRRKK